MPREGNFLSREKVDYWLSGAGMDGGDFRDKWKVTANGYGVYFWDGENVLKLIVVQVVQHWKFTKPIGLGHFGLILYVKGKINLFFKNDMKTRPGWFGFLDYLFVFIWKKYTHLCLGVLKYLNLF